MIILSRRLEDLKHDVYMFEISFACLSVQFSFDAERDIKLRVKRKSKYLKI